MKYILALKLVFRNWWRNKLFTVISVASLAIGITCTNLLTTYVIYETNIEAQNKNKERILYMSQDSPFESGKRVSFIARGIPAFIDKKYPEVEKNLQMSNETALYAKTDKATFENLSVLGVSSDFPEFFPYTVKYGDLLTVLNTPGKIAVMENVARHLYGDVNPIGNLISLEYEYIENSTYEIAAVLEDYDQSFLKFDALTSNPEGYYGGVSLLKYTKGTDTATLLEKINEDESIPRLNMESGKYYFSSLKEASFDPLLSGTVSYLHHGNKELISIGFVASILVLFIACFNYINLLLSRVLQQIKMLQVERLMGAGFRDIRLQLFTDAFLTVIISFLISFLLMHDFIGVFNSIMHTSLNIGFFFTSQVLWILILFILFLSVIPAVYISNRMSGLTESEYRSSYTGKKKNAFISLMVIFQLIISIGLLIATLTVNNQFNQTKDKGSRYKNVIEIGMYRKTLPVELKQEVKRIPGILSVTASKRPAISSGVRELSVPQADGSEIPWGLEVYDGDENLLRTLSIRQISGEDMEDIITKHPVSVLVNETFVKSLVPPGINPVGKLWLDYDKFADSLMYITGIVEDFQINSSDIRIRPAVLEIHGIEDTPYTYLHIKLDGINNVSTIKQIEKIWEQMVPEIPFICRDVYQQYINRNRTVINLSKLLFWYAGISLLLTCMGLMGITLYAVRQQRRELAIRKINGASDLQVFNTILKPYLFRILIAFIIACPIVWWLLERWLEQFVYRTTLNILVILLSLGMIVLVCCLTILWSGWKTIQMKPVDMMRTGS